MEQSKALIVTEFSGVLHDLERRLRLVTELLDDAGEPDVLDAFARGIACARRSEQKALATLIAELAPLSLPEAVTELAFELSWKDSKKWDEIRKHIASECLLCENEIVDEDGWEPGKDDLESEYCEEHLREIVADQYDGDRVSA